MNLDATTSGDGASAERVTKNIKSESGSPNVDTDLCILVQELVSGVCLGNGYQGHNTGENGLPKASSGSDVTVIIDIDKRSDGWVFRSQPAALKRIINNIAGNALKYTSSGWVHVRLRAKDLGTDANGNKTSQIKFSVSDSGRGISREFLKTKLFTPFSQENPLASGAGLGMSIVRQIIEGLGGEIDVSSQTGRGTKVTIRLTLVQYKTDPTGTTYTQPKLSPVTAGKRFLLIGFPAYAEAHGMHPKGDAENLLRKSIQRYTKEHFGMQLVAEHPEIIIVNEMTAENRLEVCNFNRDVPVIVLCRTQPKDGGASWIQDRVVTFVHIPCGPTKLFDRIKFCLEKRAKMRRHVVEPAGPTIRLPPSKLPIGIARRPSSRLPVGIPGRFAVGPARKSYLTLGLTSVQPPYRTSPPTPPLEREQILLQLPKRTLPPVTHRPTKTRVSREIPSYPTPHV